MENNDHNTYPKSKSLKKLSEFRLFSFTAPVMQNLEKILKKCSLQLMANFTLCCLLIKYVKGVEDAVLFILE